MKTRPKIPAELIFWVIALVLLAGASPVDSHVKEHVTFCPLANMGLSWCPGCGIGRSITHLFHGDLQASWRQHWFGIPALMILGYRIGTLTKRLYNSRNKIENKEERYV
jgi:hypothetical protein